MAVSGVPLVANETNSQALVEHLRYESDKAFNQSFYTVDVLAIETETLLVCVGNRPDPLWIADAIQMAVLDTGPLDSFREAALREPGLVTPRSLANVKQDIDIFSLEKLHELHDVSLLIPQREDLRCRLFLRAHASLGGGGVTRRQNLTIRHRDRDDSFLKELLTSASQPLAILAE